MWNAFAKALPKNGRPIVWAETSYDSGGASSGHIELGMAGEMGFGVVLFRQIKFDHQAEQLSSAEHESLMRNGVWCYQVDLFKASGVNLDECEHVYFNGDIEDVGTVKGRGFAAVMD